MIVKPQQSAEHVKQRALKLAESSDRPVDAKGVPLAPLKKIADHAGLHYEYVDVQCNRSGRTATITVRAPEGSSEQTVETALEAGASWWPLQMARELDDAILSLRTNELGLGLWILKTSGNADAVLEIDRQLIKHRGNWFVREVISMLRRTLARLDVASRSMYAVIEEGSCFAGTLFELALAADRSYMLNNSDNPEGTFIALSEINFD